MAEIKKDNTVTVSEVGPGPFVQNVTVRGHQLFAQKGQVQPLTVTF